MAVVERRAGPEGLLGSREKHAAGDRQLQLCFTSDAVYLHR